MNNIKNYILDILKKNYGIVLSKEQYDTSMFNPKIGMDARTFLDFIFYMEQDLLIQFNPSRLRQIDFCTLNGIANDIEQLVNTKISD